MSDATEEKRAKGFEFKNAGNNHFKAGEFEQALKQYYYALLHLRGLNDNPMGLSMAKDPQDMKEEDVTEHNKELSNIYSNMAMCQMRLGKYDRVISNANQALKSNPFNKKAKFKLAQGLIREGSVIKATNILDELQKDNPNDPAFAAERRNIALKDKESDAKQRKDLAGMFSRGTIEK
ncbi:hypothetical protein H4S08_001661 [Coemansia sp. RSA 1365]|nr:hypothetical protein H4S08_001661 [Coemansia sp. RSA 1365]